MSKTVKLELTPREAAALAATIAYLGDGTTGGQLKESYEKITRALGLARSKPMPPTLKNGNAYLDDKGFADILKDSSFPEPELFDFTKFTLPKSVVFFEYPEHGTGKLKPRLLKVETDTPNGLAGYEVDLKTGAMSWTYKNFTKAKIQNLQKQ